MSVSPADFELYSRSTGAPLPRTPGERMRMAPEVHNFVRSQGYAKKPDLWRGTIRPLLQNAAIGYGIASAAKSFADNASVSTPDSAPVREPVDVSWTQVGETPPALPARMADSGNTASPQNPRPQLPPTGGTMGTIGSMTRDLNTSPTYSAGQAVPTSVVDVQGTGFDAPVYGRNLAPHLDNMKSVWIPNADKTEPFTFAVGTVGSLLGAGIQNAPTIATQGYYDLQKGYRDLKLGEEHTKAAISGVKNWHDNKLVPWHNQTLVPNVRGALGLEQVQPGSVFGVPIDNSSFNVSPLERHPDVLPGERSHNRNHNIHRDVNRYPNDEPGPWVPDVEGNISGANISTRANAESGLGRPYRFEGRDVTGVPAGTFPSIKMGEIRANADEPASLSPQGDFIATDIGLTEGDPVNYQWYGGQRPTQNVLDEATANLRRKYADVYEAQGIMGDALPANEIISGWQEPGGSEGLAGSASGVVNYEPAPDNTPRLANVNGDQQVNGAVETLLPTNPNAGASVNTDPSATIVIDGREYPANSLQQVQAAGGRMYAMGPESSGLIRGIVSYPEQGSPRSGTMDFYLRPYDKGPEAPPNMYSYRVPKWVQRTINPLIDDGSLEQVLQEEYNSSPGAMYNRLLGRGSDVSPRYAGALAESGPYTLNYDFPETPDEPHYSEEFPSQLDALNASASMEGNPSRKKAIKGFQRRIKSGFKKYLEDQYGAGSPEAVADALYLDKPGGRLMREVDNQALYDDYALHPRQFITGRPSKLGVEPDPWL